MKKIKYIAIALAIVCLMTFTFTSCDMEDMLFGEFGLDLGLGSNTPGLGNGNGLSSIESIQSIEIVNGDLVIYFKNGQVINAGPVDDSVGTPGLGYYLLPNGTYAVSVGSAYNLNDIVIPSSYRGKSVTEILGGGFENTNINSITIPASVHTVGSNAFFGCNNLGVINYKGTVAQAQMISGNNWNYNGNYSVEIRCTNGTLHMMSGGQEVETGDSGGIETPMPGYQFNEMYEYVYDKYVTVYYSTNSVDNSSSIYETYADASGYMVFEYMVSSEQGCDCFRVYVNGDEVLNVSGEEGYIEFSTYVNYGDHIRFVYSKDGSVASGKDMASFRDLRFGQEVEEETEGREEPTEGWWDETAEGGNGEFEVYEFVWDTDWYEGNVYYDVLKSTNRTGNSYSTIGQLVQQEGYMTFDYRVSSEGGCDYFIVYVNGNEVLRDSGETGYVSFEYYVYVGDEVVFQYYKDGSADSGDDCACIKNLCFGQNSWGEETGGREEDEAYEFTWDTDWYDNEVYYDVIKSTNHDDNSVCRFSFVVDISGYMAFNYRVSSESGCDYFVVRINDEEVRVDFGETGYVWFTHYVNYGDEICLEYRKDGSVNLGDDCVYIKDFNYGLEEEPVDPNVWEFYDHGFAQVEDYYNGEYYYSWKSLNSGISSSESWMCKSAYESGYLTFYYRVSSEEGADYFMLYVNGNAIIEATGDTGYQYFQYYLNEGDYVEFAYIKDSTIDEGEDCAYIANIQFGQR